MAKVHALPLICLAMLPVARAADCKPVIDAMVRMMSASVHSYSSETSEALKGQTREREQVWVNHQIYILTGGKWRLSPVSQDELKKTMLENLNQNDPTACRSVRDEAVNGEAATVYTTHSQGEAGTVDTQTWISKSRNLPIKQIIDMDVGGKFGKSHRSIRYDYTNVQAPAGVR